MKRSPGCWTKGWSVGQVLCLNVWLMLGLARVLGMLSPLGLARVLWMAKLAPGMLAMLARVPRLAMLMVLGLPVMGMSRMSVMAWRYLRRSRFGLVRKVCWMIYLPMWGRWLRDPS